MGKDNKFIDDSAQHFNNFGVETSTPFSFVHEMIRLKKNGEYQQFANDTILGTTDTTSSISPEDISLIKRVIERLSSYPDFPGFPLFRNPELSIHVPIKDSWIVTYDLLNSSPGIAYHLNFDTFFNFVTQVFYVIKVSVVCVIEAVTSCAGLNNSNSDAVFVCKQYAEPYEESTYAYYKDIYNIFDSTYMYVINHSFTYLNIFIFICIAIFIVLFIYILSLMLSYSVVDETIEKNSTYECGFIPFSDSRIRFDISFYVVSLLFVIFDLELVFLLPWSVLLQSMTILGFFSMVLFFKLLLIGFVFEWKRGALDI